MADDTVRRDRGHAAGIEGIEGTGAITGLVGVVGAGTMGAGIAQVAVLAGHPTLITDAATGAAARAVDTVRARIARLAEKGRLSPAEAAEASARVQVADRLAELAGAALVVEAIVEDLAAKQAVLTELEAHVGDDTVLATNTSSLSVTAVAAPLRRPGRVVGLHFFNPAPLMPLVEVVTGAATDEAVADLVSRTAPAWGNTPVRATSTPGFIVNRVARPFYGEAHRLLEEHAAEPATIDALLREAGGFRMGPLELTDLVGQDVNLAVTRSVWEQTFHDPRYAPSVVQQALVDAGTLGRKSGWGVYRYDDEAASALDRQARDEPARPAPSYVLDVGGFHVLDGLVERLRRAGVAVRGGDADYRGRHAGETEDDLTFANGGLLLPSGGRVVETAGETATAQSLFQPYVVLDWVGDLETATRIGLAPCDDCPPDVLAQAIGLAQAAGLRVSVVADVPGLVVARTVAMLVNEAHDLLTRGVASADHVDTAMRLGTSYPLGPIAWGERLGATTVVAVLDALHASCPTGRYRVAPRLRRLAMREEVELTVEPGPALS
jgi:3-hydroxybutyryl-CoA dehydrogenase